MSEIIRESGLSAGAIYGYYTSKDDLLADVAQEVISSRLLVMDAGRDEGLAPAQMLRRLVSGVSDGLLQSGLVVQIWSEAPHAPRIDAIAQGAIAQVRASWADYLAHWLESERGLPRDAATQRAQTLTPAVIGLVQGYFIGVQLGIVDLDTYFASVDSLLADL